MRGCGASVDVKLEWPEASEEVEAGIGLVGVAVLACGRDELGGGREPIAVLWEGDLMSRVDL